MFKAKIISFNQDTNQLDSIFINVQFSNENSDTIKTFKLHSSNFKTTEDVQKFIQTECETLDSFTAMVELIKPLMYKEDVVKEFIPVIAEEKLIAEEKIMNKEIIN